MYNLFTEYSPNFYLYSLTKDVYLNPLVNSVLMKVEVSTIYICLNVLIE